MNVQRGFLVIAIAAVLVVPGIAAPSITLAGNATPGSGTPTDGTPVPGDASNAPEVVAIATAQRTFVPETFSFDDVVALVFVLSQFNDGQEASDALPLLIDVITSADALGLDGDVAIEEVDVPLDYGDELLTYAGTVSTGGAELGFGLLAIRDGVDVHLWFTLGFGAAMVVFEPLVDIADAFFATERPAPDPDVTNAETLFERLPGEDLLPEGLILDEQSAELASVDSVGTPAAGTPVAGTPVAAGLR